MQGASPGNLVNGYVSPTVELLLLHNRCLCNVNAKSLYALLIMKTFILPPTLEAHIRAEKHIGL